MRVLQEGDLEVTVEGALDARKFDDDSHGLSHCMKAVDIIVELADRFLFLEFKDPQHPHAPQQNREEFVQEFKAGELDEQLKYKFRDTLLYEWASGRANKPIHYYVLIADDALSDIELLNRSDALEGKLPLNGPKSGIWVRRIVESCVVFNIEAWNRRVPRFPIRRLGV